MTCLKTKLRPVLLVAATLAVLAGCGGGTVASTSSSISLRVSTLGCAKGWEPTRTGTFHLSFTNTEDAPGEVRITGVTDSRSDHEVFADVEPLGLGSSAHLDVSLGPGAYAVQCMFEDESPVLGPVFHLTGTSPTDAARGMRVVTLQDYAGPVRRYQAWVAAQLAGITRAVDDLRTALRHDDRTSAQKAWLRGHLAYEQIGAAYEAFGDTDTAINGRPAGMPKGTADPHWTGFHAIEFGLWGNARPRSLVPLADRLRSDIASLVALMQPTQRPADPEINSAPAAVQPLTLSIRAHEISENALQFALTGKDDFGSHSSLSTVDANLDGTEKVLDFMAPLLTGRIDRAPIDTAIARVRIAVNAAAPGPVADLPLAVRQRIDSALSHLTELLAPVASALEPRNPS